MRDPKHILITGASSGLGAELARTYAGPGMTLALTGRDTARLEAVAEQCRAQGATVETAVLDVTDAAALEGWMLARDDALPIDLAIANAGISAGTGGDTEPVEQVRRIFAVNVDGVMNTVLPLIPRMQARRRGQIALMASLAGFRGFPGAPAYCGSKAAVKIYGEGLRGVLAAVRPSSKARHPWVGIDDYITWTDGKGRAFDPWLRSHLSSGGKLVGPCKRSMVVEEPIAFWETWSKREFPRSGPYTIDGALVPLEIDLERGIGRYEEPNIWVTYAC